MSDVQKIEPLIPQAKIGEVFLPLVEYFIKEMASNFEQIHSIYMCGSIPKGTAIIHESDADFTLVLKEPPTKPLKEALNQKVQDILEQFPIVSKIDVPLCTIDEVLEKSYDWGFWIKIISVCLFGPDLSTEVPDLYPSWPLQKTYYEAAQEQLENSANKALMARNENSRTQLQKKSLKKLIRSIYSLFIVKEGSWTENWDILLSVIDKWCFVDRILVSRILEAFSKDDLSREDFREISSLGREYYFHQFSLLEENTLAN